VFRVHRGRQNISGFAQQGFGLMVILWIWPRRYGVVFFGRFQLIQKMAHEFRASAGGQNFIPLSTPASVWVLFLIAPWGLL